MYTAPVFNTLDEATALANTLTKQTNRYWTAIHDDHVNGWIITNRYHPQ